jgi:hypothetical protein
MESLNIAIAAWQKQLYFWVIDILQNKASNKACTIVSQ